MWPNDTRGSLRDWMADRSSAERYGLVIFANAAFFAVVVGGLWLLFQLNSAAQGGTRPDSGRIEMRASRAEPVNLAAAPESAAADVAADEDSADEDSEDAAPAERLRLADVSPSAAAAAAAASEEVRAADLSRDVTSGGGAVDLRAERPVPVDDGPPLINAGRAGDDVSPAGGSDAAAFDAAEAQWAAAGALAAELERTYPCSTFALRSSADGAPILDGEVAEAAHAASARARIAEVLGDGSTVSLGLGCTAAIGGGYVAVADAAGDAKVLAGDELTIPVLSALPRDSSCAAIGSVLDAQPRLVDQISAEGRPQIWVTRGGAAGVCRREGAAWRVDMAAGGPAAAVLSGGDILAATARRDSGVATTAPVAPRVVADAPEPRIPDVRPAPAIETTVSLDDGVGGPLTTATTDATAVTAEADNADGEGSDDPFTDTPIPVKPVLAEAPVLPDRMRNVEVLPSVTTSFTVRDDGRAQDIVVVGADTLDGVLIAEAVRAISASRFPPPEPDQNGAYRGSYAVTFTRPAFGPGFRPGPAAAAATAERSTLRENEPAPEPADPVWSRPLTSKDFNTVYPNRAWSSRRSGLVEMDCDIEARGALNCVVVRELPSGWGFQQAATDLARRLRAESRLTDGSPSEGASVRLEFEFVPPGG